MGSQNASARRARRRHVLIAVAAVAFVAALAGCGAAGADRSTPDPTTAPARAPAPRTTDTRHVAPASPPGKRVAARLAASRAVQDRLAELGYLPANAATGVWDTRTKHAVLAFQAWEGIARDGIVGPQTLAALKSAERPRPTGSGDGRRVEVHREKGVTLLVEQGRVARALHSSSGGGTYATPAGNYSIFRKELNSWSVPYRVWLPYASYFNAGIAFHGYPDVPAYPASHGCVRLPSVEAPAAYSFMSVGTPVAVY